MIIAPAAVAPLVPVPVIAVVSPVAVAAAAPVAVPRVPIPAPGTLPRIARQRRLCYLQRPD